MTALVYSLPDYTNAEIFLSCVFGAALLVIVVGLFNFIRAIVRRK